MRVCYRYVLLVFLPFFLYACAGYQLGGAKPPSLTEVDSIHVPMFKNGTLHPRVEALATSAVTSALVSDGTYRIGSSLAADAVLDGEISNVSYETLRSSRFDSSLPEELTNEVTIKWVLRDAKDPTKVLASGSSVGGSSFYVDSNLQTARQNALPDALERAGQRLVATLSSGF